MNPLVSVICLVHNHEAYLHDTFNGFLEQQVDFPFEVIVHDDASTDSSAQIIAEYCRQYPDIFVPIYQQENQYTKGVRIIEEFVLPLCRGEYIAFIDGDDYWCDPEKLQLQVDYLRAHPSCSMCVHDTEKIYSNGESTGMLTNGSTRDHDYTLYDIIAAGSGGLFANNTRLYRRNAFVGLPREFVIRGAGDCPRAIYAAMNGYVHYIGRVMAYYRVGLPDSWTGLTTSNLKANLDHHEVMVAGLRRINAYLDKKYAIAFIYPLGCYLLPLYRKRYGLLRLLRNPRDLCIIIAALPAILWKKIARKLRYLRGCRK